MADPHETQFAALRMRLAELGGVHPWLVDPHEGAASSLSLRAAIENEDFIPAEVYSIYFELASYEFAFENDVDGILHRDAMRHELVPVVCPSCGADGAAHWQFLGGFRHTRCPMGPARWRASPGRYLLRHLGRAFRFAFGSSPAGDKDSSAGLFARLVSWILLRVFMLAVGAAYLVAVVPPLLLVQTIVYFATRPKKSPAALATEAAETRGAEP